MNTTTKLTATETAREIRKLLAIAFPGVKFSLRCSRGTGYGYYDLSWSGGPREQRVWDLCHAFTVANEYGSPYTVHGILTYREDVQ